MSFKPSILLPGHISQDSFQACSQVQFHSFTNRSVLSASKQLDLRPMCEQIFATPVALLPSMWLVFSELFCLYLAASGEDPL